MRRTSIALAALLLAATQGLTSPAMASEERKPEAGQAGQYVDLQPVALPIVVNRQLINYAFVYVRIVLSSNANAAKWREKEPYFRDALVRAGHRMPFTRADSYQEIDAAMLSAVLTREATAIAGPGVIRSVTVTSQAPRRHLAPPRPPKRAS